MADTTDDNTTAAPKSPSPSPSSSGAAPAAATEGNTAVTQHGGDHDRVTMLSLRADGTPDQLNPEIIGDKDWALAAAKKQFAQQAVAAVDAVERPVGGEDEVEQKQDASIAALKEKHDAAAADAEQAAEQVVNALHQG